MWVRNQKHFFFPDVDNIIIKTVLVMKKEVKEMILKLPYD